MLVLFALKLCTGHTEHCTNFAAASQVFRRSEGAASALACNMCKPLQQLNTPQINLIYFDIHEKGKNEMRVTCSTIHVA
jgi:hypothetical protein